MVHDHPWDQMVRRVQPFQWLLENQGHRDCQQDQLFPPDQALQYCHGAQEYLALENQPFQLRRGDPLDQVFHPFRGFPFGPRDLVCQQFLGDNFHRSCQDLLCFPGDPQGQSLQFFREPHLLLDLHEVQLDQGLQESFDLQLPAYQVFPQLLYLHSDQCFLWGLCFPSLRE